MESLFSYGTLRYEKVQIATFKRILTGHMDALPCYRLETLKILDPDVIAKSGEDIHSIIHFSGDPADRVQGMVFEVSLEELSQADAYEVADYKRVKVQLHSGKFAWVYVDRKSKQGASPTLPGALAGMLSTFPLDLKCFGERMDLGEYAVYEMVPGSKTQGQWSLALLEIQNSPRHFHRIEKELFIVVHGELDIEVEGVRKILRVGESMTLSPNEVHQLKSAGQEAVRVLCVSFPAFDPEDMHLV